MSAEIFEPLLRRPGLLIERIVSHGQTTPPDQPYVQAHDEWVTLISGNARLLLEGREECALAPGDHMLIPGGIRHWVTFTAPDEPTVWLAVHMGLPQEE
ncbi:cupin domain-containing protein [Sphingobium aquiterrae]|uniref:cupin domain-containing protein n=1 Tax=Sphingobium aquiterrae TaxID=2038656 RepID=UPI00301669B1